MNNKKKRIKITAAPDTDRAQSVPLVWRTEIGERWFVAVHENGYGAATDLAKAIRAAQESVEFEAKPTQLALYVADEEFKPSGFITWANGVRPRLVGANDDASGMGGSPMITKDGYVFAYDADSRTVTVTKSVRNGASFADAVDEAKRLLSYFRGQEGSKVVGCTGIGFDLQRKIGVVRINKTEVTLKKCQAGMIALRERNSRWTR